jgi:hypothetical protein
VDDDSDLAWHVIEAILEPQPQFLHPVERPLGEGSIAAVVAGGEAQARCLNPGHQRPPDRRISASSVARVQKHATLPASLICLVRRP